ncbi:hypothetical protein BKA62DRAFT_671554 [Auriculariales sp. MPI-PUGE-AT-0066]|nr:hypothetical protein BKA62DRAFT_671554 [Auriculariales sp. MPI-PUGE-AT-0066]
MSAGKTKVKCGPSIDDINLLINALEVLLTREVSGIAQTGPKPPALAGGLNVHGTFEGDASLTRSDDFLGNNHDLNMTLFNQLIDTMDTFGAGNYNLTAAAEFRWIRIQDSIARNPTFDFGNPRFATAYAESSFPLAFFSNLSEPDVALGTSVANIRSFFLEHKYPENFHRRGTPFDAGGDIISDLQNAHPIAPGRNDGVSANSYAEVDFLEGETSFGCAIYHKFVNKTVALYPKPNGALLKALNGNLDNFFESSGGIGGGCTQLFPYN